MAKISQDHLLMKAVKISLILRNVWKKIRVFRVETPFNPLLTMYQPYLMGLLFSPIVINHNNIDSNPHQRILDTDVPLPNLILVDRRARTIHLSHLLSLTSIKVEDFSHRHLFRITTIRVLINVHK